MGTGRGRQRKTEKKNTKQIGGKESKGREDGDGNKNFFRGTETDGGYRVAWGKEAQKKTFDGDNKN